jgi:putative flavoprotein involved in K+ transport
VCDGETLAPSVVIWCTGFTADYSWIDLPVTDAHGRPRHQRGVATDVEGLYFVGQRWQHRRTSALLGGVGADAEWIAARVTARSEAMAAV